MKALSFGGKSQATNDAEAVRALRASVQDLTKQLLEKESALSKLSSVHVKLLKAHDALKNGYTPSPMPPSPDTAQKSDAKQSDAETGDNPCKRLNTPPSSPPPPEKQLSLDATLGLKEELAAAVSRADAAEEELAATTSRAELAVRHPGSRDRSAISPHSS